MQATDRVSSIQKSSKNPKWPFWYSELQMPDDSGNILSLYENVDNKMSVETQIHVAPSIYKLGKTPRALISMFKRNAIRMWKHFTDFGNLLSHEILDYSPFILHDGQNFWRINFHCWRKNPRHLYNAFILWKPRFKRQS